MPVLTQPRLRALSSRDPLMRRHLALVEFALRWAGLPAGVPEVVRHLDPFALEALACDRLDTQTCALVLRYLRALDPEQCRSLALARNRFEAQAGL